jgi:hypothetical protein
MSTPHLIGIVEVWLHDETKSLELKRKLWSDGHAEPHWDVLVEKVRDIVTDWALSCRRRT